MSKKESTRYERRFQASIAGNDYQVQYCIEEEELNAKLDTVCRKGTLGMNRFST
jgi:hypothetical protein